MLEATALKPLPRELISLHIGGQFFCIDIMAVREIRGWTTSTPLPHAPATSRGVVNLRGAMLGIVDLGVLLGLPTTATTTQSVIMVVEVSSQVVGLLVDGVSDVLTVTPKMVQPPPSIAAGIGIANVTGLIEIEGRLLTLLQLEAVIASLSIAAAA